jgi:pimeloyl-ACP methyl ester carboxylesterase
VVLDWTQLPDVFYIDPAKLSSLFFADPSLVAARQYFPPPAEWDERFLRNREASVRLAFHPYLHSRRLKQRLRFATVPALVVWGEDDRLLPQEHAQAWRVCMPSVEVSIVKRAGHFPHVEQADMCLPILMGFLHRILATEAAPR